MLGRTESSSCRICPHYALNSQLVSSLLRHHRDNIFVIRFSIQTLSQSSRGVTQD